MRKSIKLLYNVVTNSYYDIHTLFTTMQNIFLNIFFSITTGQTITAIFREKNGIIF